MNIPLLNDENSITIPSNIQYAIGVDGINVRVEPAGTSPNVVYRIGDGTVHPEGWDNVDGNKYLDFYISTGAKGATGDKGEDGESAYNQAVDNGYIGTEQEFYDLLTNVSENAILAGQYKDEAYTYSINSANSATASANSATASASSATASEGFKDSAETAMSNAQTSETNASSSASASASSASQSSTSATSALGQANIATAQAVIATDKATEASDSATSASTSASNASDSATEAEGYANSINPVDLITKAEGNAGYLDTRYYTENEIDNSLLSKTNTSVYTPTLDYHPSTKKYVDDNTPVLETRLNTTDEEYVGQIVGEKILKQNGDNIKSQCTAWVNFDGTTTPPTIRDSFNVSDVVKSSSGRYVVYFEEDMDNTNYGISGSAFGFNASRGSSRVVSFASSSSAIYNDSKTIGYTRIDTFESTTSKNNSEDITVEIKGGKN